MSYSYALTPGGTVRTHIPVLLLPPSTFAVPGDWSPGIACQMPQDPAFVCGLADGIHQWFGDAAPSDDAALTFDLNGLPKAPNTQPDLQAKGLTLALADITNP